MDDTHPGLDHVTVVPANHDDETPAPDDGSGR
jgi:hypothetical protein